MEIVNLTGHNLVLGTETSSVTIRSAGKIRLDTRYTVIEHLDIQGLSIPLLGLLNGETNRLPEPQEGTLYVVSGLVAGRVKRPDMVAPARLHKAGGRVEYARALLRYAREFEP